MLWPIICSTLLISTHLQAGEPQYKFSNTGRQYNVNPSNMMNGTPNPMRNMFGGSNRYRDGYDNYRYVPPPPPGYPPVYGCPGNPYPQPPVPYSYPAQIPNNGYSILPQGSHQPQMPAAALVQPQPTTTGYINNRPNRPQSPVATTTYQPAYQESYRFRPLETMQPTKEDSPVIVTLVKEAVQPLITEDPQQPALVTQLPLASLSYPSYKAQETEQPPLRPQKQPAQTTHAPQTEALSIDQDDQMMRFRPLDKPGYSQ
ncbi:MAG: hypothetical protein KZQ66_16100 [Candidatus Thiodiazotropha sp. (ex Lucinoma aequizonata)]|nr:hypothetical protein [Candidatus Thiodiazotropha sp. (ex Lucinoma aequizonata)]MCU7899184.1 hypothetical protein [Candidatus Thiodiazotropha sp. (ex Lucinoma aequizonata)]MCU7903323.1 hypothetical protein [Candidatus Thiodiazotropha sp. (ex Lucinoma aequizonata)]MCU7911449.1 hypothetical protein [Candidatus Thiodiazotropha sp. (ex Lucinoma aequizonata)]